MRFPISRRKEPGTVDHFNRELPSLFENFFGSSDLDFFSGRFAPAVDVEEREKEILVKAELPGMSEKDLEVSIQDNYLTIKGEKSRERKEEKEEGRYIVSERSYGSFCRTIPLPEGVSKEKIKADYKKGLLEIRIPREKSAQKKKISIDVH